MVRCLKLWMSCRRNTVADGQCWNLASTLLWWFVSVLLGRRREDYYLHTAIVQQFMQLLAAYSCENSVYESWKLNVSLTSMFQFRKECCFSSEKANYCRVNTVIVNSASLSIIYQIATQRYTKWYSWLILAICKALNSLKTTLCLWVVRSVFLTLCTSDSRLLQTTLCLCVVHALISSPDPNLRGKCSVSSSS
jgi:hypothetical protein